MTVEHDLAADLAAQIRAAVAETAPSSPLETRRAEGREDAASAAIRRAQAHLTPTIPEAAPFARAKRVALRLLRFVWRDQAAFNALSLEASASLAADNAAQRGLIGRLPEEIARYEEELRRFRAELDVAEQKIVSWERRGAIEDARLAALETATPGDATGAHAPAAPASSIPSGVYSLFEERFRGAPEEITAKQRGYVPFLEGAPGAVLDVGCGRGELLRLLADRGIPASGVEINPIAVAECRKLGLDVEEGEGLSALMRRPSGSLGAVVALQVVEHWSPEAIFTFLREARRVLAPGGVLVAETINVDTFTAWKAFFLDPSHVRPVPPDALRFLAEAAGFADARIEYRAPLPSADRLAETSENEAKLNRLLFGPQDYALIARVPRKTD